MRPSIAQRSSKCSARASSLHWPAQPCVQGTRCHATVAPAQHQERRHVGHEAQRGDEEQRPGLDLRLDRLQEPPDALDGDRRRDDREQDAVHERGEHLDALEAEGVPIGRGPRRDETTSVETAVR